jgi:GAF domain-containing protein
LQAANTIENARLFQSSQYRSNLLQTAAEVSRTASSILDVDQLIQTVVDLIRDRFDFYYVGLFMIDDEYEYAVLTAGTGEAGRIQVKNNHKLEVGGESMIGWSVKNRQARIALDVGEDAVFFKNKYLPDTHSEMALPLISRDEVIGALTVQSEKRGAFSDEDIILLQTMADQVANAIQNARFFTQTQTALSETEQLYKITQELLSVNEEEKVYRVAMDAIADSGIDSSAIYMYVDDPTGESVEPIIEQKAIWSRSGKPIFSNGTRFKASELVIEQVVPLHESVLVEDVDNDTRLTRQVRESLKSIRISSVLVIPLSTYQSRLGFVLVAYKTKTKSFSKEQNRYYHTITQQMVVAIENLRLLAASQRRARREEIIREITGKIRNNTNIDDILKTTVSELGKVVGAPRGGVMLNMNNPIESSARRENDTIRQSEKARS